MTVHIWYPLTMSLLPCALTLSAFPAVVATPVSSLMDHCTPGFGLLQFSASFCLSSRKPLRMVCASPTLQPPSSKPPSVPHHIQTTAHLNLILIHPQVPTEAQL
jgi:hypothetical protein